MSSSGVEDKDLGYGRILDTLGALDGDVPYAAVGILEGGGDFPGAVGGEVEADEGITLAGLATVHEFGATIKHPGGTPYKVVKGRAVFMKKGSPGATGETAPHDIRIPARAPIRKTLEERGPALAEASQRMAEAWIDGDATLDEALGKLGFFAASEIQATIQRGVDPPNARSTIRKKGTSKPLIAEGTLVRSYSYEVRRGSK